MKQFNRSNQTEWINRLCKIENLMEFKEILIINSKIKNMQFEF